MVGYELNQRDEIVRTYGAWVQANGKFEPPAKSAEIKQFETTCLWHHVRVPQLVRAYKALFTAIRKSANPAKLFYRCDSPQVRRLMRMDLHSIPSTGLLRCENHLIAQAQRPQEIRAQCDSMIAHWSLCHMCARIRPRKGAWVSQESEPDILIVETTRFGYEICPRCVDQMTHLQLRTQTILTKTKSAINHSLESLEHCNDNIAETYWIVNPQLEKEFRA